MLHRPLAPIICKNYRSNTFVTENRLVQPVARRFHAATIQAATRVRPKTHTIVAPVGISKAAEMTTPARLTPVARLQPNSSRARHCAAQAMAARPGTIR
jgi:hypothetical protein